MGGPVDFTSGSGGAGGDSAAGGSDGAGVGGKASGGTGGTNVSGSGGNASGGTGGTNVGGSGGSASGGTGGTNVGGAGGTGNGGTSTTSGTGGALGGTGGTLVGAAGATEGDAGEGATDPYGPRSGSFKALVFSGTEGGFAHYSSIASGRLMFTDLGSQFDFESTFADQFAFTAESLAPYELVVFLNTAGNPLTADDEAALEEWFTTKDGAFVGTHSATDTESSWIFYKEVTGQYHNLHTVCCSERQIEWEPQALDFPALRGLPSPWIRREEWFLFNDFSIWSQKPGFKILGTVQIDGETQPVSFAREYANFRSFYTVLGHDAATFDDTLVRRHIAGGMLWAVRREHLLD
jgi:type 1 glutamine amidotransferase